MNNRDDFTETTKRAVAARAGWHCSFRGCPKSTVGPSDEAPDAVMMIGKAAHISAAAPGPGARRYLPSMTSEQRKHIDNAIWLCADHADMIDKDEVTYPIELLKRMKREHEAAQALLLRTGAARDLGAGLLSIGPDIVCIGDLESFSENSWTLRLKHYVLGDVHKLTSYISRFQELPDNERYVLSNEFGDGRVLPTAPTLLKREGIYTLRCPVSATYPRVDVHQLGSAFAMHPVTNDMYLDKRGNLARVSGLDYLPQKLRSCLSVQRNESAFDPDFGMRFFEVFEEFKGSSWLNALLKLDVIRMAAIPQTAAPLKQQYTPLLCVSRVFDFELLSEVVSDHRLPVRLRLDIKGLGEWRYETTVYMPTQEQMAARAELIRSRHFA